MADRAYPRARERPRAQHFLRQPFAADLVRNASITSADLVVDIGAGTGAITRELAARAGRVLAIEADPALAAKLAATAPGNVQVVAGDALRAGLPAEPFRVVANLPFAITSAIVQRLLDDPRSPLLRADLVVQWGFAVKRASQRPSTKASLCWAPWFELTISRRLPPSAFRPPPAIDAAAVLTITRRPDPLVARAQFRDFRAFLDAAFTRSNAPVARLGLVSPLAFKRLARRMGFAPDVRPPDLDVAQWAELFHGARWRSDPTGRR